MGQEQQNIDCIYDFIYLDTKRLASYLAQLNEEGVLISIKQTRQLTEEKKELSSFGLNVASRVTTEDNESVQKHAERHYDSSSTALYSVIDRLDELGFINREIDNTALGQFLLCSGSITFQDIRMMRNLWDPIMNLTVDQNKSHLGNKHSKGSVNKSAKAELDNIKAILTALPHALLMTLRSGEKSLWSSLEEEHLKINSDDITLKHGSNFAGEWHVLGVLDAKPDNGLASLPIDLDVSNDFTKGMTETLNLIRAFLGRPAYAYGITPVAIFRAVSRK